MGQQQLLLLVLATVIVGLATVAGIQAFDEGQTQAAQDALVQRGIEIGNDIYAASQSPEQFGGIDFEDSDTDAELIAERSGYEGTTVSAEGAGNDAECDIDDSGADGGEASVECSTGDDGVTVEVDINPGDDNPVEVTTIDISS